MKRLLKVLVLILVIMVGLLVATNSKVLGSEESEKYKITAEKFTPQYEVPLYSEQKTAGRILGWIRNITVTAAVVIIAYFGLKFMYGSVEQRADYKKSFIPLIVGLFIVASATSIMSAVWKIGEDTNKTASCNHQFTGGSVCTQALVCKKCKSIVGPLGHEWTTMSYTASSGYLCSRCNKAFTYTWQGDTCAVGPENKHSFKITYGEYNEITATCKYCGLTRSSKN